MSKLDLNALNELPKVERVMALAQTNDQLEKLSAEDRVAWALETCPANMYCHQVLVFRRQ